MINLFELELNLATDEQSIIAYARDRQPQDDFDNDAADDCESVSVNVYIRLAQLFHGKGFTSRYSRTGNGISL